MPQVLPAIAGAAFAAGAPLVVTNAILGVGVAGVILHTTATLALTVGASYAIGKLTAPAKPKPSDGSIEFKQPLPSRFFTYGHVKVSGPVLLLEKGTITGESLYKITAFGSREIASFIKYYNDGDDVTALVVPSSVAGVTEIPIVRNVGGSHGRMLFHKGESNQLADEELLLNFSPWTDAHRLRGIPYAAARFDSGGSAEFAQAFPGGPIETAVVGGVKVYDPRRDPAMAPFGYYSGSGAQDIDNPNTWEFSDNQRLCTLDWLTWRDGYDKRKGLPTASLNRIDWATWVPQIQMADELVPLRGGGTEKRYRVATRVSLDEPRSRVLHRLLEAGDQQLFMTRNGLIGSRGGVWQAPTVSLAVEDMPEAFFTHGVARMERINEFELTCMLPQKDYVEYDLAPWGKIDDADYAAGIKRRARLELNQVPSNGQAQRLAKIYMHKRNPAWNGQIRTSFAGLNALGEQTVSLTFAELHTTEEPFNGPFWVNGQIQFLADKTGITFPVASADPTAYDWDEDTEEQFVPGDEPAVQALKRRAA